MLYNYFTGSSIGPSNVDSARQNLASSLVNGFVNAAFGQDKLLMEEGSKWLYKNKEHGKYRRFKCKQDLSASLYLSTYIVFHFQSI